MTAEKKIIFGVSGWIAKKFGIDTTIIRIGFVFFGLFVGSGILLYLLLWVVKILEEKD